MYTAKLYQSDTGLLVLTDFTSEYHVTDITGLGPSGAHINMTNYARTDGAILNSKKLNPKTITITLLLEGDVEAARQQIYGYFRTKEAARFYFANGSRDAYIDGWVQSVEVDLFSMSEQMILTLFCPDPYFQADEEITASLRFQPKRFYFPFAIDQDDPVEFSVYDSENRVVIANDSDTPTGFEASVLFYGACSSIVINNLTTQEFIGVDYAFQAWDLLTINTKEKQKKVTVKRNSVTTSLMADLEDGSTFPVIAPGDNEFNYHVDGGDGDDNAEVVITYNRRYRGL